VRVIEQLQSAEVPSQRSTLSSALWSLEAVIAHWFLKSPPAHLPRRLNLGCGTTFAAGWINADFATLRSMIRGNIRLPEWNMDATRQWHCPDAYFEAIHCEHVLEHFPYATSIRVLRECHRTLQPGGVLRVSVPDLRRYVDYYEGKQMPTRFQQLGSGPVAMSKLTQCHRHVSVWDGPLMQSALQELGFAEVAEASFMRTRMSLPCIDNPDREWESVYVEGIKPG
jgi:SAM-dependent methyltransferase